MVETTAAQRRIQGNACLARDCAKAPARFLRRNLNHVLDAHESETQRLARGAQDMIANERSPAGWDYPTLSMLQDLVEGNKPVMRIEALQLRHPDSKTSIRDEKQRGTCFGTHDSDWLPDPRVAAQWRCSVRVSITDTKADAKTHKRPVHAYNRGATIFQVVADADRSFFNLRLDKPFSIELDQIFACEESGIDGSRRWRRTITKNYTMDIAIQCENSEDSAAFISRLENRSPRELMFHFPPAIEGAVKATWANLPKCPAPEELLGMRRPYGHKVMCLGYKMEVAMGWSRRQPGSVVERYNQAIYPDIMQLPTPSALYVLQRSGKQYKLVWKFTEGASTRFLVLKALTCPFCQDNRAYPTFARLRLHCLTNHDQFAFETEPGNGDSSEMCHREISIKLAVPQRERPVLQRDDAIHMDWIAPGRPFDMSKHLRQEDDWVPGTLRKTERRGRPLQRSKDRDSRAALQLQATTTRQERLPLHEVPNLPQRKPKKHRVPYVPGVSFYRTSSKQVLETGDLIADSDDDVDESWANQAHDSGLEDLGITGAEKSFTMMFNLHLAGEQSESGILMRDALVRFVAKHEDELRQQEFRLLFTAKLEQLVRAGIIREDVVEFCRNSLGPDTTMEGVSKAAPTKELANTVERSVGAVGLYEVDNGSNVSLHYHRQSTRQLPNGTPQSQTPRLCICDKTAYSQRGAIACANQSCVRKDYHLVCVGLERRMEGWRCGACS